MATGDPPQKKKFKALHKHNVVCSAITLRKLLMKLQTDYGWSFYDEKDELHLEQMQMELIIDVARATKDLLT